MPGAWWEWTNPCIERGAFLWNLIVLSNSQAATLDTPETRKSGPPPGTCLTPSVVIQPRTRLFDLDLRSVWTYRELIYFLVWRDVKSRYQQTLLGVAWAVLQPVFTMLVFWIVFSRFVRVPSDGLPYPLFVFIGLLPWTYFSQAVTRSSVGLVGNSNLVAKVYFPRLILPLAAAIVPAVDFLLSFVVLVGLLVWYGVQPMIIGLAALPFLSLFAYLTALSVGVWLSALNVKYRDVAYMVPFLTQIWMYASPVIYPASVVPEQWQTVFSLNPMVAVIGGFRWALAGSAPPDIRLAALSLVGVVTLLTTGLVYFRRTERQFADVI
jgi:lipopolysaccharide transport system permease protein